jgi:DNA-binding CsgD family transcriptional regulator
MGGARACAQNPGEGDLAPLYVAAAAGDTRRLLVSSLLAGDSPRLGGVDDGHVQVLAASGAPMPPILVHRETMRVIDGMHRLRAAKLKGQQAIEARFFDGTPEEAFVTAVRANVAHGLPLTLADREAAAARIVASHPQYSDRWIASATGIAASTVAAVRRRLGPGDHQPASRIGRDGRVRPLSSSAGRRIARDVITERPGASLREIAKIAGVSPGTVRDVRDRLRRGDDPVPPATPRHAGRHTPAPRTAKDRTALLAGLSKDPSLRLTQSGRALLHWLHTTARGPGTGASLIDAAPPHCSYLIAQLARRCADEWLDLATHLEQHCHTAT